MATNTNSSLQTAADGSYYLEIFAGNGTRSQPELKASKTLVIQARAGEQYRVISEQGEHPDNVVAIRTDNDLEVRFDNGVNLIIEDYYLVCNNNQCGITLSAEGVPLSANDYADEPFSGESTIVYSQGNIEGIVLLDLVASGLVIESQDAQAQLESSDAAVVAEEEGIGIGMMALAASGLSLIAATVSGSGSSSSPVITITAPTTTIRIDSISEDTGTDSTDFITSDNDGLTITGTLSAALQNDEILEYSNDNGATFTDISSSVNGTAISYEDTDLTSTHTVQFRVTDTAGNSGPQSSQLITIEGNDNAPVFTSGTEATVSENQTSAYTAAATDADNDSLEYSITGGTDSDLFSIDADTGVVTFNTPPDFEIPADDGGNNDYEITVTASDGVNETSQTVNITVTDITESGSTPVFTSGTTATVSENETLAYTVAATDADGDTLEYSITGGTDSDLFSIDEDTGVVTFNTPPDFESPADDGGNNDYEITVTASDGVNETSQTVNITVTDVNESGSAPVFSSGSDVEVFAAENQLESNYDADATDPDDDTLVYSITGGADAARFDIDATSGVVTFKDDNNYDAPDFEDPDDVARNGEYELVVTATDETNQSTNQNVTITLTDVQEANIAPEAIAATNAVTDDGTVTGIITATDADLPDGELLTFSTSEDVEGLTLFPNGLYSFDASSYDSLKVGEIQVITIEVTVTDDQEATDTTTLTITLTGTNDAPEVIATTVAITEATILEGTITATDVDLADGENLEFSTDSNVEGFALNTDGSYTFDASSYDSLKVGETLALEIQVTVTDDQDATAQTTLTITVTGTNDAPVPAVETTEVEVTENAILEGRIAAADVDLADGENLAFSTDSDVEGLTLNEDGTYSFDALSYDSLGEGEELVLEIPVTVTDDQGATAQTTLIITVTGTNDVPEFSSSTVEVSAAENQTDTNYTAAATDADGGDTLVYSITGGADSDRFEIDSSTGVVTFKDDNGVTYSAPDFEAPDDIAGVDAVAGDGIYDLIVTASDGVTSSVQNVTIELTDIVDAIDLSEVVQNGNDLGFTINESEASANIFSVSNAGDVNGDGYDDVIVGFYAADLVIPGVTPEEDETISNLGTSYVIFGKTDGSAVDLSDIEDSVDNGDGLLGIAIYGAEAEDQSGWNVSNAGDVNGDGYDDLLIGAKGVDLTSDITGSGASYVVFGGENLSNIDLVDLGDGGFVINGGAGSGSEGEGEDSGLSVSSAGDVNGDGLDDLLIGAPDYESWNLPDLDENGEGNEGIRETGTAYVVFGKDTTEAVDLSALGDDGFAINGTGLLGFWVSDAGDVNGDGLDDILVGNWLDLDDSDIDGLDEKGTTYLIYGKSDNSDDVDLVDPANLDPNEGIVITGVVDKVYGTDDTAVNIGDRAGFPSSAGDVNGDGYDDFIIGANGTDTNNTKDTGISYVIFGGENLDNIDLADPESYTGFVINGANEGERSGWEVSSAGDFNGDGLDDLIIGAPYSEAGASYLVYGKTDTSAIELSEVALGIGGFVINGFEQNAKTGWSVSGGMDVDGDGFDDVIVGVRDPDSAYSSYVIYGGLDTENVMLGSDGDDDDANGGTSLIGSASADYIVAGQGNDVLIGNGGADVLRGGQGDDILEISDASFAILDGGTGTDTLRLAAGLDLNLIEIANNRLSGIEVIELNGSLLTLGTEDILTIVGNEAGNELTINGSSDDTVDFKNSSWALEGVENGYEVYTDPSLDSSVRVLVQQDIVVHISVSPIFSNSVTTARVSENLAEGTTVYTAIATDMDTGETLTYSLGGDDAKWFEINGSTGVVTFNAEPDYETPLDKDGDNDYQLIVRVSDGANITSQNLTITVTNIIEGDDVELSDIQEDDNSLGFLINGLDIRFAASGWSVSSAGDVNGDGLDDLIIGMPGQTNFDPDITSASYVVYGKADGTAIDLQNIVDEIDNFGFAINGATDADQSGFSVSSAGDLNGDGYDDLIIGAPNADPNDPDSGASYVVFGSATGSAIELSTLEDESSSAGFVINGENASDNSGLSVSSAGDVNGDGLDDLIIGAPNANGAIGASYVVFGTTDATAINLADVASGDGGFVINGINVFDQSGFSVSSAGDVNGDGLDDLIIGAPGDLDNNNNSSASYVVYGTTDTTAINLTDVVASNNGGFVINGASDGDQSGYSVSGAGDVNGDGYDDLIIGAPNVNGNSGASYVVFGSASGSAIELSALEDGSSSAGFVINGENATDKSGFSVSSAGDINGDGLDDLIIGAPNGIPATNRNVAGLSYVVYGTTETTAIDLTDVASGDGGFVINGIATQDHAGYSVSGAGDVNGDGFDDLIVGVYGADNNDASFNAGDSYVIFGGQSTASVVLGTDGDDILSGDSSANQIVAGQGDDTLIGNGGADVLRGGSGDDVLAISDGTFGSLDGGNGTDTLRFDEAINLDFTTLSDNKITSIEQIDLLNDDGDSVIKLNLTDVLNLGEGSNDLDEIIDLVISGDSGDIVTLDNTSNGLAGSWVEGNTSDGFTAYEFESLIGSDILATVLVSEEIVGVI